MSLARRLPVRWRLALASAGLTLVILVAFAGWVGRLSADRLREDFRREVRTAAADFASRVQVAGTPVGRVIRSPRLDDYAMSNHAVIRIISPSGRVLTQTTGAPDLGEPRPGMVATSSFHVATRPVLSGVAGPPAAFVQYGRRHSDVEATVDRLWLFLLAGVLGGSGLALLAGLAVADRAMRPIAALTETARAIAVTRDPSRRIPEPDADDEVAELARTLQEMLHSLDQARAETQQALGRQREFVADASHELRTPLTSVLTNLEMLQEALDSGDDRESVDSALRSARRMRRLVADLLLLARADAGRLGERRACDLAAIAGGAVEEIGAAAHAHRLVLESAGEVPVEGASDELHRMASNLIENAVRHTPPGTEVRISASREAGDAVLEVADDGPGVPADLAGRIFERFVRSGGDSSRGTGLGLAIVRAVAESHGGKVELADGPGARFVVRLPLAQTSTTTGSTIGRRLSRS